MISSSSQPKECIQAHSLKKEVLDGTQMQLHYKLTTLPNGPSFFCECDCMHSFGCELDDIM